VFLENLIVVELAKKLSAVWNRNFSYRIHKHTPLDPALNQLKPLNASTTCSFNIHLSIAIASASRSPKVVPHLEDFD
jgi:hypothetical protein